MPSIRDSAIEIFKLSMNAIRSFRIESKDETVPTVFLLSLTGDSSKPLATAMYVLPNMPKQFLSYAVQSFMTPQTVYIGFVTEVWGAVPTNNAEADAIALWAANGNSLEDYPERNELLMGTLEGVDLQMLAQAVISGDVVSELKFEEIELQGKLVDLGGLRDTSGECDA